MRFFLLGAYLLAATIFCKAQTPGNALCFDGVNDYASCVLPTYFNNIPNSDFTVECWIKLTYEVQTGENMLIFNARKDATHYTSLQISKQGIAATVCNGTESYTLRTNQQYIATYIHVAYVWNATTKNLDLYVDGLKPICYTTANINTAALNNEMTMGGNSSGQAFRGTIDELRIWNYAMSSCQIVNAMRSDFTITTTTGLLSCYNFNQGTSSSTNTNVTSLKDLKLTNHLTLKNFGLTGSNSNWITSNIPLFYRDRNLQSVPQIYSHDGYLEIYYQHGVYSWFESINGSLEPILSNNYSTYIPNHNGSYTVSITDLSCQFTANNIDFIKSTPTNISIDANTVKTKIYPNATSGGFTIDLGKTTCNASVEVFNSSGIKVDMFSINDHTGYSFKIDQPAGVYIVKIKPDAQAVSTFKIIKK